MANSTALDDLRDLVNTNASTTGGSISSHTLPSIENVVQTLQSRFKADKNYVYLGHSNLIVLNPERVLENLNDDWAERYEQAAPASHAWTEDDSRTELGAEDHRNSGKLPPHPYCFAGRLFAALTSSGTSQAVVSSGISGSGKSYSLKLVLSQLLRIATSSAGSPTYRLSPSSPVTPTLKRVPKLVDQIRAAQILLDAFGNAKTTVNPDASRLYKIWELHYANASSLSSRTEAETPIDPLLLSGAKILTFGLDKSRLIAPLAKGERTYHIFYHFLAGADHTGRSAYHLLSDASEYKLLASSGCYTCSGCGPLSNDEIAFREIRSAFTTLGFKDKHTDMIFKILSAILLLGNITFAESLDGNQQESVVISPETRTTFFTVCSLLGVTSETAQEDFERAFVNKTSYVRKEVVCTLLTSEGAIKQRDSLVAALYSILVSFVVECINHKIFLGDDEIKGQQRNNGGRSITFLDLPGFQTKNLNGAVNNSDRPGSAMARRESLRRSTLIEAWEDDAYQEFTINYSNELLQHWLNLVAFSDDFADQTRRLVKTGAKLPDVDLLDRTEMNLELLRGGLLGSKADSKLGGMLGGLTKTCSNLKKGKLMNEQEADDEWIKGTEERFLYHSRYVSRSKRNSIGGLATSNKFGIKHFGGTVHYSYRGFVERDLDLLDSEFVRVFRSLGNIRDNQAESATGFSSTFLCKLFSGPTLAAESHPRDSSVLVATQVAARPLRRLSPIKVSENASTSVSDESPEFDIEPVSSQLNDTLVDVLESCLEVPIWNITCVKVNNNANSLSGGQSTGAIGASSVFFDIKKVREQAEMFNFTPLIARRRIDWAKSWDFKDFLHRYDYLDGLSNKAGADEENLVSNANAITTFLARTPRCHKGIDFDIHASSVCISFECWQLIEHSLWAFFWKKAEDKAKRQQVASALKVAGGNNLVSQDHTKAQGSHSSLGPASSVDTLAQATYEGQHKTGYNDASSDDLIKNAGHAGMGTYGNLANPTYDLANFGRPNPALSLSPSNGLPESGRNGSADNVWGNELKAAANYADSPTSPNLGAQSGYRIMTANSEKVVNGGTEQQATTVEEVPTSTARRWWLGFVWAFTWWIPSIFLRWFGRMKRPDIQIAWREKVALCFIVFLICGTLLFLILGLGKVLCPEFDYAWNIRELSYHQGKKDNWVSVAGQVYDITGFYKAQHSDIVGLDVTSEDMMTLAGKDLTPYFPVPLTLGCPDFITNNKVFLQAANFTPDVPMAYHYSGQQQSVQTSALHAADWYTRVFLAKMRKYHKGPLVYTRKALQKGAEDDGRIWAMYRNRVYDLSDYIFTIERMLDDTTYRFLPVAVTDIFQEQVGQDITAAIDDIDQATLPAQQKEQLLYCLNNVFYRGDFDFRSTPKCVAAGYFLVAFTAILVATILAKFLAALQITKKRNPELQDKFVICQVPCYTEGEESLKKTIDSLANLKYDDKRKLLFVICDGMIVGSGNDRPTPRFVLDILGVDNLDPDPLLFKSLGVGNKQINYGKVYSGLYEFEGHVLPYVVVVKIGKPTERSRPGNRGKRDSQILLMRFLNRVHFDAEMSPLELEIYHQIKNVIGVDPQLYEYLFTVDADTEVYPDSLNRLVAVAADDSAIVGLCGETKLSNEQASWWTMIQVYEYFISHHMAKAFESLFGSVTCLPGCFTLFRLRTADKGRPLLISNLVIDDYAENEVDTLHKKNLLHLGEDRYLTTLILKHFPHFKTKFTPDARAMTAAPETWKVLLSQRRRWINSTVHNLFELVALKDLCGFCCFSMRFIVIIDVLGTLLLPGTTVYLVYLIVIVATKNGTLPVFSIIMLGATYGLQVIIFLLKRQWQFIGWLVIYILAFPIYSFFFPIYSFWHFDDFSWGNTRIVVGEGKNKKILAGDDDQFDDSMIPMRRFSEYQQQAWDSQLKPPSQHSPQQSEAGFSYKGFHKTRHSPQTSFHAPVEPMPRSTPLTMMSYPAGPQPIFSPFNQAVMSGYYSPAGSIIGSDMGGYRPPLPATTAYPRASQLSFAGFQAPPSTVGMANLMGGNRNSSAFSLVNWTASNLAPHYSMSSVANPFSDQNRPAAIDPTRPTDTEIVAALRNYLRTQDLLQVTKRTTREAMAQLFPQADLASRKAFINQSIDAILQGQI